MGSFRLTFSYLPHFNVVCASVSAMTVVGLSEEELTACWDKSSLLHSLTEGDTGRTSPNAIVSYHIRKQGNEVFSAAVRAHGFPYKWAQRVCGIGDNVEVPDNTTATQQVEISAQNVETVVGKLKQRFRAQVYLLKQIVSLGTGVFV